MSIVRPSLGMRRCRHSPDDETAIALQNLASQRCISACSASIAVRRGLSEKSERRAKLMRMRRCTIRLWPDKSAQGVRRSGVCFFCGFTPFRQCAADRPNVCDSVKSLPQLIFRHIAEFADGR